MRIIDSKCFSINEYFIHKVCIFYAYKFCLLLRQRVYFLLFAITYLLCCILIGVHKIGILNYVFQLGPIMASGSIWAANRVKYMTGGGEGRTRGRHWVVGQAG